MLLHKQSVTFLLPLYDTLIELILRTTKGMEPPAVNNGIYLFLYHIYLLLFIAGGIEGDLPFQQSTPELRQQIKEILSKIDASNQTRRLRKGHGSMESFFPI